MHLERDRDNPEIGLLRPESLEEASLLIDALKNPKGKVLASFSSQFLELQKVLSEPAVEEFPTVHVSDKQLRVIGRNVVSGEARIANLKDPERATLAYVMSGKISDFLYP